MFVMTRMDPSFLSEIFVGRENELEELGRLWTLATKPKEFFVYVLLNSPGVGKTTFLNYFGESLHEKQTGLFFSFRCLSSLHSYKSVNRSLVQELLNTLEYNYTFVKLFIQTNRPEILVDKGIEQFESLVSQLVDLQSHNPQLSDVVLAFQVLSGLIPVFFMVDEVQEFEMSDLGGETALHYLTKLLKDIMKQRVLVVLSGTQFHILNKIGDTIGSPINQKVKPFVLGPLTYQEVMDYQGKVTHYVADSFGLQVSPELATRYATFLGIFSGGHPRTIERVTSHLLLDFERLQNSKSQGEFNSKLLDLIYDSYYPQIFSSEKLRALDQLRKFESFSLVERWLTNRVSRSLFLGTRPIASTPHGNDAIKTILYQLMNIGIIIQNGNLNYHATSYFHIDAFLRTQDSFYQNFLSEVLTNKYFHFLCGSHSGLGYVFEHVFAFSLLLQRINSSVTVGDLKLLITELALAEVRNDESGWAPHQNVLYHTPTLKEVDFILRMENRELVLVQLTTQRSGLSQKLQSFGNYVNAFSKKEATHGLFISLYEVSYEMRGIVVVSGDELVSYLGLDLYNRFLSIKDEL